VDETDGGIDQTELRELENRVRDADIVVATVGQHWLKRIQNDYDPVRLVIHAVIASRIPIIPVLVNDARMPGREQLPPEIHDFAFRNAFKVDPGQGFDYHVDRLIRALGAILGQTTPKRCETVGLAPKDSSQPQPPAPHHSDLRPTGTSAQTFISHSSHDRKTAEIICQALESRGLRCWISSRDVAGGENYQASITQAIRKAKVMVLVFTGNANNSDEIKKEIALASRNKLTVIPIRIEDVLPNDALDFELATRQWIDFFEDWERAIDTLCKRVSGILEG
jgi:hypothetical protein